MTASGGVAQNTQESRTNGSRMRTREFLRGGAVHNANGIGDAGGRQ